MPVDPSNPFTDLSLLNGVTFDQHDLARASAAQVTRVNFDVRVSTVTKTGATTEYLQVPGQVHIESYYYIPPDGTTASIYYKPPVFGVISFSNIFESDGVTPRQFAIRGFSPDGLLLSQVYYGNVQSSIGDLDTLGGVRILSDDGFGAGAFSFPVTFGYDPQVYAVPVCFAEGTQIVTASGLAKIEDLSIGDEVVTVGGKRRSIKWIGWTIAQPPRHACPWEVNPVRVKAHAIAPNVPERDVRLSPGHAIHIGGVLVPVGHLINGATIVQDEVETIRYFHIELETHDLLLAEGLPCESYFDDGNRRSFANSSEIVELHGRLDPKSWDDACAPVVAAGPQLTDIQQRLNARAEELGWARSEEPDLSILADGVEILPQSVADNRYQFALPATDEATLRSNHGVLAHVMPGLADHRRLGVAVSRFWIDGIAIDLDDAMFDAGFCPAEVHEGRGWRWTNGEATLKLGRTKAAMIEIELAMVAPSWTRAAQPLRAVA
ncbi:Hint domain-containing protein [Sphingomonas sp. dw_22]|uniref:Hint domain-containing protein n=1 Tax=Sphingomonas sp. dw_22 TaxID=2721175 RepID=UPI001BD58E97|nr:Hint domain-containing protein [Sphingomonas sp. dw_22]